MRNMSKSKIFFYVMTLVMSFGILTYNVAVMLIGFPFFFAATATFLANAENENESNDELN